MKRIRQSNSYKNKSTSPYLPQANAYFSVFSVTPTAAFKIAVNAFIQSGIINGWWGKWDLLSMHGTVQEADAGINMVNPTGARVLPKFGPSFANSIGWTGDGTDAYLDTQFLLSSDGVNYKPSAKGGQLTVYTRIAQAGSARHIIGALDTLSVPGGTIAEIQLRTVANRAQYSINNLNAANALVANSDTTGLFSVKRDPVTQTLSFWRNGAQIGTDGTTYALQPPALNCYALAINSDGTHTNHSTNQISLTGIGAGDIGELQFYTDFQTLATALGFNV